ncbi:MAG: TIGR03617 family F420-dependent LLM class oxidoreductase, partial [Gammaproteobacteria bacterium]
QTGFDGVYTFEGRHDPFLPLLAAAGSTGRLTLSTGIAVAFARNPMLLANLGHDLQLASKGRFILGLGSQIKPHIEKRFSATWSHPAARMREMVRAIRSIWAAWQNGSRLDFRGEFYTHTLMTPFFDPGPNPYGPPPIYLAAVGPVMTEVAGEVGDGMLVHPFNTPAFVAEDLLPALARGRARAGREPSSVALSCQLIVALGDSATERAESLRQARAQVAFYASTPAYRPVLERHGWGELQPRLNQLSKEGRWQEMSDMLAEELLDAVVVQGDAEEAGGRIRERCLGWCRRVSPMVYGGGPEGPRRLLRAIKG